jgi:hypothetical protein
MAKQDRAQVRIIYDWKRHGWIVEGKRTLFATKMAAENYCIQKLRQHPIVVVEKRTDHQELPQASVWTGAPWDRSFSRYK